MDLNPAEFVNVCPTDVLFRCVFPDNIVKFFVRYEKAIALSIQTIVLIKAC